jgi:hypothetical protein
MVGDDLAIIDNIANRRRRDALIVEELATLGATVRPEDTARRVVPEELQRRYRFTRGLKDLTELVEAVYVELAPEASSFQLYDMPIMDAIASRLGKVRFATLFKKTKSEGIAPAQQELNIARAVELAQARHPEDEGLPEVVGRVYGVLVPASVAIQQSEFANTMITDPDTMLLFPEIFDFGTYGGPNFKWGDAA